MVKRFFQMLVKAGLLIILLVLVAIELFEALHQHVATSRREIEVLHKGHGILGRRELERRQ